MKPTLICLGLLLVGAACRRPVPQLPLPPLPFTGREEVDVFLGGKEGPAGTSDYRIPAMVVAKDGTLLAFAEGRPNGGDPGEPGDINVSMKASRDLGRTWGPVTVLADRAGFDHSDPRPVLDGTTGALFVFYVQWPTDCAQNGDCVKPGMGDEASVLLYRRSLDHGRTWEPAVNLNRVVKDPTWRSLNPGPGNGIQLTRQTPAQGGANGRLLLPAILRDGRSDFHVVTIYSDDHGATWKASPHPTPDLGATEADVVELGDGRLLLSARNDQEGPARRHYLSQDGGLTWIPQADLGGVQISRVDASLLYLPIPGDPRVLLVGPLGNPPGRGRVDLGVWESRDEGRTFPASRRVAEGFAAYSQVVELPDGSLGFLYEAEPSSRIRFLRMGREILTP